MHRFAAVAGDFDERNAPLAAIEIDDLLLTFLVLVDVNVVVVLPEFVELLQGLVRVSAPVGAVDRDSFRHARPPRRSYLRERCPVTDRFLLFAGWVPRSDQVTGSGGYPRRRG